MRYFMNLRSDIFRNVSNTTGYRTLRKFILLESDDWGSIRMPSLEAFKKLESQGLDLRTQDAERYNLNDHLASSNDLENLFEILNEVKDAFGQSAVMTPITIVANPDFKKIRESGFSEYYYEPFNHTIQKFQGSDCTFKLWKEGIDKRLFVPQMHGREHLNVNAWMHDLRNREKKTLDAFNEGFWGYVPDRYPEVDYQAAFSLSKPDDVDSHASILTDGLNLFESLFGYRAVYFVPPNGPFNNNLNKVLAENGVKLRATSTIQNEPLGYGQSRKVFHWQGQKDKSGLIYTIRNCFFEPSQAGKDWVDSCLNDIKIAFRWNKPAIISTHRVNYIGALNVSNRSRGLMQLRLLLKSIMKNWPEVLFITSADLGEQIINERSYD